jgi:hypothetical protein
MADHVHANHTDAHLADDDHNWYPERTMPQGTQENGVDFQHEDRDMNHGSVIRWMVALSVAVVIIFVALWGAFYFLGVSTNEARKLPSPIFAKQQVPPYPRLLPNPFDDVTGKETDDTTGPQQKVIQGPMEYGNAFKARENEQLEKLQMWDPENRTAKVPASIAQSVLQELKAPPAAPGEATGSEVFPSDTSGGTATEDRLK